MAGGFFDKIKNLVIEEDSTSAKPAAVAPAAPAQQASGFDTVVTDIKIDVADVEQKIEEDISKVESFSVFTRFQETLKSLEAIIPDEATRFKAAAATTQLDAQMLIDSVSSARTVLEQKAQEFTSSFVQAVEAKLASEQQDFEGLIAKIEALTKELADNSAAKSNLANLISSMKTDLEKAKIDFQAILNKVGAKYQDVVTKIQKNLS